MRAWVWLLVGLCTACASGPKRLQYTTLPSERMQEDMQYAVWAPRDLAEDEQLPLVVFLHGGGDGPDSFDKAGLGQYLDRALAEGRIPRMVIVVPQGNLGFWENWQDGSHSYRDWVLREAVPDVQKRFHTLPCPDGCHVMGNSMGGHGALRFALLEANMFRSVTAISAPIFDTERMMEIRDSFWWGLVVPVDRIWGEDQTRADIEKEDLYLRWKRQEDLKGLRLVVAWGDDDRSGVIRTNEAFEKHLQARGIEHTAIVYEGNHSWKSWTPVIERALREQLAATSPPPQDTPPADANEVLAPETAAEPELSAKTAVNSERSGDEQAGGAGQVVP